MSNQRDQIPASGAGAFSPAKTVRRPSFDELELEDGQMRPHWQMLMKSLDRLGRHELIARWQNGRRLIREHGVSYKHYGDPQEIDRPWSLDLVPLLITADEWEKVAAGLAQRSRLFNLILADVYGGAQHLLRDGFLPPELVYSNPGFLRPCRGLPVPRQVYLQFQASDLGRSPDGQWWVLSDRTQAPGGAGYAWENRTVLARLLPEEMERSVVQPLANFFQHFTEGLCRLAPSDSDQPSLVLLTPGPYHGSYFEHAYLARQLGCPLVEGADLTVRDQRVFLKTIEGLQKVDVILRRTEDAYCDPLELRADSFLGVSGLVEATRAGRVTVANALGAGLLESPAFLPFLPGLCRQLLGEELLLPSVATWWCGQADALRYVIENLDHLVLKPAFGSGPGTVPSTRPQRPESRSELVSRLRARPASFVAQERLSLSEAPTWVETQLQRRPVLLRSFVANDGAQISVLPGGLTRVAKHADDLLVSIQQGVFTKDTWVLTDARTTGVPRDLNAQGSDRSTVFHAPQGVPSRAADHLFWLGRYTERLEQLLRVLRGIFGRISSESAQSKSAEYQVLSALAANFSLVAGRDGMGKGGEGLAVQLLAVLYDPEKSGGVRELLGRIRLIASGVRDRFSGDTWRILGRLDADAQRAPGRLPLARATALIHQLILDLAAFSGMEMENMSRGRAWRFLEYGRRLERGLSVLRLLQAALPIESPPPVVLEPVLEIADSVMTYRRLFFDRPRWTGVLALLLGEGSNPRSLAFQIDRLGEHQAALEAGMPNRVEPLPPKRLARLDAALRSADWTALGTGSMRRPSEPLDSRLREWSTELGHLSDEVTHRYFSHSLPRPSSP